MAKAVTVEVRVWRGSLQKLTGGVKEDGPWKVYIWEDREKVVLQSDDFTHDVTLEIRGDFESKAQKIDYAVEIAGRLNAWGANLESRQAGFVQELYSVEQALGRALGYPWYKDDQKNFPGATEADGVCIGEHVAGTLADEAARKIIELEDRLEMRWVHDANGNKVAAPSGTPDGIACRDETIRLLEAEIETLKRRIAELEGKE